MTPQRPERAAQPPVRAWSDPLRWLVLPWTLAVTYPLILVSTALFGTLAVTLSLASKHLGFYAGVAWARSLAWGTWVRVRVAGREHLAPGQSYVMLANHQGAYDILALYGFLGREFRWVMKEELRKVPFLGWGCAAIGHIFIDRRNSARAIASLEAAKSHLTDGVSVLLFPEGTRSTDGRLLPFKKGGFIMAIRAQAPIVPVAITGGRAAMRKGSAIVRPVMVSIRIGAPIETAGRSVDDRDDVVDEVRRAIEGLIALGPVAPGER